MTWTLLAEIDSVNAVLASASFVVSILLYVLARRADVKQDRDIQALAAKKAGVDDAVIAQLRKDVDDAMTKAESAVALGIKLDEFLKRFESFEDDMKQWLTSLSNDIKEIVRNPHPHCIQESRLAKLEVRTDQVDAWKVTIIAEHQKVLTDIALLNKEKK